MISLNSINIIVKEIYKQLCLHSKIGWINTMNIQTLAATPKRTKNEFQNNQQLFYYGQSFNTTERTV